LPITFRKLCIEGLFKLQVIVIMHFGHRRVCANVNWNMQISKYANVPMKER
jgi:hypothetical protein